MECVENEQGHREFQTHISDYNLLTNGYYCCEHNDQNNYISRSLEEFSFDYFGGSIAFEHAYSALQYWGGKEDALVTPEGITGQWRTRDAFGTSIWAKLIPANTKVDAWTYANIEDTLRWAIPGEDSVSVGMVWEKSWAQQGMMRGNRPGLILRLSGPNFLRRGHFYSVETPHSIGVEPIGVTTEAGMLNVELVFWPGVTPGTHLIMIDDVPVTLELDLIGYNPPPETYRIGAVSINGAAAKNRDSNAAQAVSDLRAEVDAVEVSIARQETYIERSIEQYIDDAKPVQARFQALTEALGTRCKACLGPATPLGVRKTSGSI